MANEKEKKISEYNAMSDGDQSPLVTLSDKIASKGRASALPSPETLKAPSDQTASEPEHVLGSQCRGALGSCAVPPYPL